jgi:hypothetical protein
MRLLRAGHVVARRLNCGVMRHLSEVQRLSVSAATLFVAVAVFVAVGGCTKRGQEADSGLATKACYYPPLDIGRMERELASRGISFSKKGDCLAFKASKLAFESAELAAFGEKPPSGLNTCSEDVSELVRRLADGGVAARILTYAGKDCVVWGVADAERAEELLDISLERREVMRRMREDVASGQ